MIREITIATYLGVNQSESFISLDLRIIGHNQPYLGMGIRHTGGNKVKGSNLTRIRGGAKNFEVRNEFLDLKIVYSNC